MVLTITLTGANIISQTDSTGNNKNNLLKYSFPTTATFDNHEIALTAVSLYYSWFNIDAQLYQNSTFYYYWLDSVGNAYPDNLSAANPYYTVTTVDSCGNTIRTTYYYDAVADLTYIEYPVVLPDGIYELQGIVNYLQYVMQKNLTYGKDSVTQNNVYYINMQVNPTAYCYDITCYQITVDPPDNITYLFPPPTIDFIPLVKFPTNFNAIVGFTAQNKVDIVTKPSPSVLDKTFVKYSSNVSPQLQPNPTLVLTCSGVSNPYSTPSTNVYSLSATGVIGSQIQVFPPTLVWLPLTKGTYPSLTIGWVAANGQQVNIRDPNMCITFAIRNCNTDVIQIGNQS